MKISRVDPRYCTCACPEPTGPESASDVRSAVVAPPDLTHSRRGVLFWTPSPLRDGKTLPRRFWLRWQIPTTTDVSSRGTGRRSHRTSCLVYFFLTRYLPVIVAAWVRTSCLVAPCVAWDEDRRRRSCSESGAEYRTGEERGGGGLHHQHDKTRRTRSKTHKLPSIS